MTPDRPEPRLGRVRRWWRLRRFKRDPIGSMKTLARKGDEHYKWSFREACLEVLGEDPEDWE